jgi:hypothetical protein
MVQAWVVFPLVLGALSLGLGLLVARISGSSLPWPLLLPVGSAAIIAISSLVVMSPWPSLVTPIVAGLAAFGLVLGVPRRVDGWALGSAVAVFACFGIPVLASGTPTFAGYIKLDDTATFFALTDRATDHGRSLAGLAPSSYEAALSGYLAGGYPLGSILPLGIGHTLVRADVAWLFQPWLCFSAAMLALCLYQLGAPLVARKPGRAVVALVAAQPALLYGYALWGGVKELAAVASLATAVALAAELKPPHRIAAGLPLAVACAALLDAFSVSGALWLVPLVPVLIPFARAAPKAAMACAGAVVLLAVPALAAASDLYLGATRGVLTQATELGNLIRPLHFLQVLGVWPSGDFRLEPDARVARSVLLLFVTAAALVGLLLALRQKAVGLLLGVASALTGAIVFVLFGSPWVAGKALAIGSPFVLLAAAVGCIGLVSQRSLLPRRASPLAIGVGAAAGLAVLGGVAWSNALAYHDADLAPYSQLTELERIGSRFAGDGPTLMTEYQPYGVRHFLRRLDPEGSSELRRRPVFLRDGLTATKGEYVDLDRVRLADLLVYRTLVLRKSPTESRPPAPYRLVWVGRWYQVWQRSGRPEVLEHASLGDSLEPGAPARCALVDRLAGAGRVVAYPRQTNLAWSLGVPVLPRGWTPLPGGSALPTRSGKVSLDIAVPRTARYRVWVGGSIRGRLAVAVDGTSVGSAERQLQNAGQWLQLGAATIPAGRRRVDMIVDLPALSPGTGGGSFPLGPLLLQPERSNRLLEPLSARALCGRNLDWVEALGVRAG